MDRAQSSGMERPTSRSFVAGLKALDAYPKVNEDFFTKTLSGGVITMISTVLMVLLFLSELRLYLAIHPVHELSVDTARGEKISINVDITFPHIPCAWLSLDAMDISGELHLDLEDHELFKQRLSKDGVAVKQAELHNVDATKATDLVDAAGNKTCMSCYGAEEHAGDCCNTCDEVRAAYRRKGWALTGADQIAQCKHDGYLEAVHEQAGEGCHMWGKLEVNKVAGNFHFAAGRSYQQGNMHVHDMAPFGDAKLDFRHSIKKLSFGTPYPGMRNPLDNVRSSVPGAPKASAPEGMVGMYQYFLKVVPTAYTDVQNVTTRTNQYSVTENFKPSEGAQGRSLPGVFFFYDLSPIKVMIHDKKSSFLHFLTNMCAIVGGVFTVSGIVDAIWYQGQQLVRKKMELGKFS